MFSNDATIIKIKHQVLAEIAKLVFDGKFEEEKDNLPFKLIPGPKANFRCCIYKEREVVRQRIRLAEGKCPGEKKSNNIVQIIASACEECPISRYVITDNCQKCMAKKCQQACNFGAISMGRDRAYINPSQCKECGMCAKACPYNAIAELMRPCKRSCPVDAITMDENGVCEIDESKCIECGKCIHSCPFGAISSKSYIVDIINDIKAGKHVVAMLAPAAEGQFGENITMASWKKALLKVGFYDFVEVGLGGDLTAAAEAKEWAEAYKQGSKKTTSCCPAFVNLIKQHFPELSGYISNTVSPMCAVSRLIKAKDKDAITVFIGPCVAKKSEAADKSIEGNADYVVTFGEIRAIMKAKGVVLEPEENNLQDASVFGKRFGNGGGVANAITQCLREDGENDEINILKCDGIAECKKALLLLKAGRLTQDFIEGMACVGGCVGGPSRHTEINKAKKARDTLIASAKESGIHDNLKKYDLESFSMHK